MFRAWRFDLYILKELWPPTLLGFVLYTFLLLMNHFFVVAGKSLSKNLGFDLTLQLFLVGIPALLVLSIPMAVALGSLIAMGRISSDSEWIALQGAGQGPSRLLVPVLCHGLLASAISFFIYGVVVPRSNFALRNLRGEVAFASHLASDLKPRVFYDLPAMAGSPVLYVEDIRAGDDRRLAGVLLIQRPLEGGNTEIYRAEFGDLYPAPERSGALILDLYDGVSHVYDPDDPEKPYWVWSFEFVRRELDARAFMQALLKPPGKAVQDFSLGELWEERRDAARAHAEALAAVSGSGGGTAPAGLSTRAQMTERRLDYATVELHQRLALPLACLLFAFLGIPLGLVRVRSGKGAGFAISLLAFLVYYVAFKPIRNAALVGNFHPALASWLANLIILVWGLLAYWRLHYRTGRLGLFDRVLDAAAAGLRRAASSVAGLRARGRRGGPLGESSPEDGLTSLSGTSTRFVARLDRYIGRAYLRVLGLSLASGFVVYALVEVQGLTDDLLRSGQPLALVLSYLVYFAPSALHVVLPVSCLVGAVVAMTVLSRSGELVAIKAGGIGMRRATASVLFLTLLVCVVQFLLQDRIAPGANRQAQAIRDRITGRAARTYGEPVGGRWSFGPGGHRLYNYRHFDPARLTLGKLHVFDLDPDSAWILAHRAGDAASWRGGEWSVSGGWYRGFPRDADPEFQDWRGKTYESDFDPPEQFAGREISLVSFGGDLPEKLGQAELRKEIRTLRENGHDVTKLLVAYYGKFAHALAPLVMVLLGLPFAFKVGRRGSLYGIGVALLLVLVYWAAFAIFTALGDESLLRPDLAAWAPNVLFGLLGTYLMLYIKT